VSEASRQRYLHVTNRLAELRAKHGAEDMSIPDWLDSLEGYQASIAQDAPPQPIQGPAEIEASKEVAAPPPPQNRRTERSGGKRQRGADW